MKESRNRGEGVTAMVILVLPLNVIVLVAILEIKKGYEAVTLIFVMVHVQFLPLIIVISDPTHK